MGAGKCIDQDRATQEKLFREACDQAGLDAELPPS
jgi:hypothetical protein